MTTNNSMTKIISKPFGALNVDVYQNDKHQYYMTREQIGRALECKEPRKYIAKIHERNADRLDSLSTVVNLTTVDKVESRKSVKLFVTVCVVLWKSAASLVSRRLMRSWTSAGTLWNL